MGLDTYARNSNDENGALTDQQKQAFASAGINLCGGMFSGQGNDGSFRGKVYAHLIEQATGVSLYQDWIEPSTVEGMYEKLTDMKEDIDNLVKFLDVCVDCGLGLTGWW